MSDSGNGGSSDKLRDFERRLETSLNSRKPQTAPDKTEGTAAGLALRVITELVVAIGVCMGIGWMADRFFGTAPWIMLGMMPLGFAAGVFNVMRLAQSKQADEILGGKGPVAPSVKDDDDED